ncbi:hypothetical protein Tco_0446832 [Tanacetum coccineum]
MDIFRDTLQLSVETPDYPFIEPENLKFIQRFLKIVGYEGIVDKVSAFYTKNLAQPWQTMLKVFNRCLTTRTFGHDQTKINVLQIIHAVINCVHVDYARLLWRDFLHCVQQKKDRLDENYHSIKDDIPLASVYTTGNVDVPTFQPQPVESTQGTNRTPSATRTPTLKPSTSIIPPPRIDRERDEIPEATLLSLTMHKTAIAAEEQENVAKVQEKILEKDITKMVDGNEEDSYASAFTDLVFQDKEDTRTRIEPENHKEHPETVEDDDDYCIEKEKKDDEKDDDVGHNVDKEMTNNDVEKKDDTMYDKKDDEDDDDDHDDHALVRNKVLGNLSLEKTLLKELTTHVSHIPDTTSNNLTMTQPTSSTHKVLPGSVAKMSRRSELIVDKTKEHMKEAILRMVNDAVKKYREIFDDVVSELVSKELSTHAPKIIDEPLKRQMKNKVLNFHPTVNISTTTTTADLKEQLYLKMKTDL